MLHLISYLLFLGISYVALMGIFNLSISHAYFWKTLPMLVVFSAGSGWLLYEFALHDFFVWHLGVMGIILATLSRTLDDEGGILIGFIPNSDKSQERYGSISQRKRYFTYSSLVYLGLFAVTYLVMLNSVFG